MKALIVSANTLPASPAGAAYEAGAALRVGHTVEVFETFFTTDVESELEAHIRRSDPDVIGISVRLVNGYVVDAESKALEFGVRPTDARPMVRDMVNRIREVSGAQIVLGGPGFNYFGSDWLECLDLDYGLRGEATFFGGEDRRSAGTAEEAAVTGLPLPCGDYCRARIMRMVAASSLIMSPLRSKVTL